MSEFVNIQNNITDGKGKVLSKGKVFTIPREAAEHSRVFRQLFKDFASLEKDVDFSKEVIPFDHEEVSDDGASKVLKWMTEYKDMPKLDDKESDNRDRFRIKFTDWEKEYFESLSARHLYEFLLMTHYLEITRPYERGCQYTASLITGKTPSEIRDIFGVMDDFSPEGRAKIEKENAWASGDERA